MSQTEDERLAGEVHAAVRRLNEAVRVAAEAGLSVEFDMYQYSRLVRKPQTVVSAHVTRVISPQP